MEFIPSGGANNRESSALLKRRAGPRNHELTTSNIMHINARSVSSKMTDLHIIMDRLPVSILALTETWLTEESEYLLSISGYTTICSSRTGRAGGGVALVLRQDIVFHILNFNFSPTHSAY